MTRQFARVIEAAGGFVHTGLELQTGHVAAHGKVSLAGVDDAVKSLVVPWTLAERATRPGPWMAFLAELGYTFDQNFWNAQSIRSCVLPLFCAANHSASGGRVEVTEEGVTLYGTTFCYSFKPRLLRDIWGIE